MLKYLEESSDKPNDKLDDRLKCIIIAMRIINGDHVPSKDRAFLAENEPEMYSNAILLRRQNDKPKKYDSLFEDKKNDPTDDISSPITFEGVSEKTSEESISRDNIEVAVKPNA